MCINILKIPLFRDNFNLGNKEMFQVSTFNIIKNKNNNKYHLIRNRTLMREYPMTLKFDLTSITRI